MKKSSLLALSLASLVSLVGCNQGPSKSASRRTVEKLYSFYYEGEYSVKKAKEAMTPVTNGQGYIWDYENGDEEYYYLIEGYQDSYVALLPAINLYPGETEGSYVAHFSDGDLDVPNYATAVVYSTNFAANTFLDEESMLYSDEWGYVEYWNTSIREDEEGEFSTMNAFDLTNATEETVKGKIYLMWASYVYFYEEPAEAGPVALLVSELLVFNAEEVFNA